jgi:predicted porin
MGSNRIRTVLGLAALAAFGAAEIAVVYGVIGAIVELTLGVDLPLIGLVDSRADASASGCT